MRIQFRMLAVALIVALAPLYAAPAHAGVLAVLLVRSSLDNDSDPGSSGLWQYEGGVVENGSTGATIGHYITTRRVTTSGTSTDNTAATTTTLFFSNSTSGDAPNNVTIQGAWSFTSGSFSGSVSAASFRYHVMIGSDAYATTVSTGTTKLVIDWVGIQSFP